MSRWTSRSAGSAKGIARGGQASRHTQIPYVLWGRGSRAGGDRTAAGSGWARNRGGRPLDKVEAPSAGCGLAGGLFDVASGHTNRVARRLCGNQGLLSGHVCVAPMLMAKATARGAARYVVSRSGHCMRTSCRSRVGGWRPAEKTTKARWAW